MVVGLPSVPLLDPRGAVGGYSGRGESDKLQMVDSTVICARHAAGTVRGKETSSGRFDPITGTPKEAPGRSRGGFTTKIHLHVNGAGLPIRTEITSRQDSDDIGYDLMMAANLPQLAVLVADRGDGYDKIREDIESRNALPFVGKTVPQTVF